MSDTTRSVIGAVGRAARIAPTLARGFPLTLLLALVGTAGQVVVPIAVQQLVDRHLLGGAVELRAVVTTGAIAVAALLAALVATRTAMLRLVRAGAGGLAELRVATFGHLHRLPTLHVASAGRGALVSRVTSDVEAITDFLEWGGVGMIVGGTQIVLVLTVMLVYDPVLAAFVVTAALVYALLLLGFQRVLRRAYDRVRVRVGASLAAMGEATSGLPTIRAYGLEDRTRRRVGAALDDQFRAEFRTGALGAAMFSTAELFAAAVTAGVVAIGVLGGPAEVSAGQLVAFLFLVTLFIEPVQLLVEVLNEAQTAAAGLRRVLGVLDTPVEIDEPRHGVELPAGPLSVTVRGLRYRYPTGGDVLCGIDLHLDAGARVAVVGATGSGKSTFVHLLTRLLEPTGGTIELGGVPLHRVRLADLRRRVAFVPQDGFLFDTTLADNIRYGAPDADDERVAGALEELGLGGWVAELPGGLHTPVGERGGRLSAGERQLVALTRACIAGPDLLVLDEATSAVDPALEVRLRGAIARLTRGRTSITVAHRLSTAQAAEEVLVFHDGRIVERGPHDRLVHDGRWYSRLHADWQATT